MINKKIKNKLGFSLLEVIIAIFIITLGLIGILSLVVQSIQVQYINKNNMIASQLAQEGIELVRNIRDNNWIDGLGWKSGIGTGFYIIDYINGINSNISDTKLYIDGNGFYKHGLEATTSNFNRLIEITDTDNGDGIDVKSTVIWQEKNNSHSYIAETELYDWK